jgi:hypothetical protein
MAVVSQPHRQNGSCTIHLTGDILRRISLRLSRHTLLPRRQYLLSDVHIGSQSRCFVESSSEIAAANSHFVATTEMFCSSHGCRSSSAMSSEFISAGLYLLGTLEELERDTVTRLRCSRDRCKYMQIDAKPCRRAELSLM